MKPNTSLLNAFRRVAQPQLVFPNACSYRRIKNHSPGEKIKPSFKWLSRPGKAVMDVHRGPPPSTQIFKTNVPKSSFSFVRFSVVKTPQSLKRLFFGFRNVLNIRLCGPERSVSGRLHTINCGVIVEFVEKLVQTAFRFSIAVHVCPAGPRDGGRTGNYLAGRERVKIRER